MAKSLNITVIAEGVEDKSQFDFLRAKKCDEIQGYYISKPGSATEIAEKFLCVPSCHKIIDAPGDFFLLIRTVVP